MSYLVLARRWRPQKFADLVGQDVVVRTLKNAMQSGNLAHAYLLCGIRGVGKTTIARLMAMAVNCEAPSGGEPCGTCAACQGILAGANLDVQEMDAASHTGVDDVRDILDGVRYPPSTLKYKVYIIDEAHMLSKSAFNALLKTLEEPPARVLFILATTEVEKLPVTVRSRCQRFDLRRLGADEIADYLTHVFGQESIAADADALHAIARAADGSVRDALSLAERVLAFAGKSVKADDVRAALGLVGSSLVSRLSDALFAGEAAVAVKLLREAAGLGHSPRTLLETLAATWHSLACVQVDEGLLDEENDAGHRQWLRERAGLLDGQSLDLRYQVLLHGLRDLGLVDERLGVEMVLIRLCGLQQLAPVLALPAGQPQMPETRPAPQPAKQKPAPEAAKRDAARPDESKAAPLPEKAVAAPAAEPQLESTTEPTAELPVEPDLPLHGEGSPAPRSFDSWQAAVEAYGKIRPGVAAMLEHVICLEYGAKVRLALDKHQERAVAAAERSAFSEWMGREIFWESRQGNDGESLSQARVRQAAAEAERLRHNAESDPHVQALMQEMGATLVNVMPAGIEVPEEELMSGEDE